MVIATAASGLESGGKVMRMDGEEVNLLEVRKGAYPSEEEVLGRLLEEGK